MKKILAIIPARSGSKGLKDKNIKPFNGLPLMAHTIKAAIGSGIFTSVVVSTDSKKYQNIAVKYGAEAPFLRPKNLSGDKASSISLIEHALKFYKAQGQSFDLVILLQPTSPLRNKKHILNALKFYQKRSRNGDEALVSVVKAPVKSKWLMRSSDNFVNFCFKINKTNPQRQSKQDFYIPNGAIYIASASKIKLGFYTNRTLFYEMDEASSIDIDTLGDFKKAVQLGKK